MYPYHAVAHFETITITLIYLILGILAALYLLIFVAHLTTRKKYKSYRGVKRYLKYLDGFYFVSFLSNVLFCVEIITVYWLGDKPPAITSWYPSNSMWNFDLIMSVFAFVSYLCIHNQIFALLGKAIECMTLKLPTVCQQLLKIIYVKTPYFSMIWEALFVIPLTITISDRNWNGLAITFLALTILHIVHVVMFIMITYSVICQRHQPACQEMQRDSKSKIAILFLLVTGGLLITLTMPFHVYLFISAIWIFMDKSTFMVFTKGQLVLISLNFLAANIIQTFLSLAFFMYVRFEDNSRTNAVTPHIPPPQSQAQLVFIHPNIQTLPPPQPLPPARMPSAPPPYESLYP